MTLHGTSQAIDAAEEVVRLTGRWGDGGGGKKKKKGSCNGVLITDVQGRF